MTTTYNDYLLVVHKSLNNMNLTKNYLNSKYVHEIINLANCCFHIIIV